MTCDFKVQTATVQIFMQYKKTKGEQCKVFQTEISSLAQNEQNLVTCKETFEAQFAKKNLRNNETKKFVSYKKNVLLLYGCFSCDAPARKMNQMSPYVYSPFTQLQRENEHLLPNYYKTVKTFCSHILIAGDYNRRFINCHFVTLHK